MQDLLLFDARFIIVCQITGSFSKSPMCASHDSTTYIIIYTLYLQSVYKFVTYVCVLSGNK